MLSAVVQHVSQSAFKSRDLASAGEVLNTTTARHIEHKCKSPFNNKNFFFPQNHIILSASSAAYPSQDAFVRCKQIERDSFDNKQCNRALASYSHKQCIRTLSGPTPFDQQRSGGRRQQQPPEPYAHASRPHACRPIAIRPNPSRPNASRPNASRPLPAHQHRLAARMSYLRVCLPLALRPPKSSG